MRLIIKKCENHPEGMPNHCWQYAVKSSTYGTRASGCFYTLFGVLKMGIQCYLKEFLYVAYLHISRICTTTTKST